MITIVETFNLLKSAFAAIHGVERDAVRARLEGRNKQWIADLRHGEQLEFGAGDDVEKAIANLGFKLVRRLGTGSENANLRFKLEGVIAQVIKEDSEKL